MILWASEDHAEWRWWRGNVTVAAPTQLYLPRPLSFILTLFLFLLSCSVLYYFFSLCQHFYSSKYTLRYIALFFLSLLFLLFVFFWVVPLCITSSVQLLNTLVCHSTHFNISPFFFFLFPFLLLVFHFALLFQSSFCTLRYFTTHLDISPSSSASSFLFVFFWSDPLSIAFSVLLLYTSIFHNTLRYFTLCFFSWAVLLSIASFVPTLDTSQHTLKSYSTVHTYTFYPELKRCYSVTTLTTNLPSNLSLYKLHSLLLILRLLQI